MKRVECLTKMRRFALVALAVGSCAAPTTSVPTATLVAPMPTAAPPTPLPTSTAVAPTAASPRPTLTRLAIATRSSPSQSQSLSGSVTDMDGNIYRTVKIGDQCWMAENLKVTHYRDGEPILAILDRGECLNLSAGAYSSYESDPDNIPTYGLLYNWYAVDDGQGLCPDGWHVPSDEEWKQLEMCLGMSRSDADKTDGRGTDEGGKLKAVGTGYWQSPNAGASNESGFSALPGGGRACYGIWGGNCYYMGNKASFWTSTEQDEDEAWFRNLDHDKPSIIRRTHDKRLGFSVRCVQDQPSLD